MLRFWSVFIIKIDYSNIKNRKTQYQIVNYDWNVERVTKYQKNIASWIFEIPNCLITDWFNSKFWFQDGSSVDHLSVD